MPDGSSSEVAYSVVTPPISTTNTFAIGSHNLTTGERLLLQVVMVIYQKIYLRIQYIT